MQNQIRTSFFWLSSLCFILLLKALVIIFLILNGSINLGPDEAQYWTWSQLLDWGYYSKPPAIAWQIGLGTQLFGNTELGVRVMSIFIASGLSIAVYALARSCQLAPSTAFWAGVTMALTPLGMMASFLAITDGGMVLCWTLACIIFATALTKQRHPSYYLLGFVLLCGALFKWPIYLFWIFVFGFMPFYPFLISMHAVGGFLLSLLGLLPSLIWNSSHDWVTFRHVASTVSGDQSHTTAFFKGNFWEFLVAQAGLLSPILFALLVLAGIQLYKKRHELTGSLLFCGIVCFSTILVYATMAFFQKMQGNWADYAYPTGIIILCWYACEVTKTGKRWLKAGVILSVLLCGIIFSITYIQAHSLFNRFEIPYKINPFKHNVGWNRISTILQEAGYDPKREFLFGDKYQISSLLSFYGPQQQRAYFLNIHGIRHNQFSFWPSMAEEQLGHTGYFVWAENMPHLQKELEEKIIFYFKALRPYFRDVEFLGLYPLFNAYDKMAKGALIFKCIEYNGKEPTHSHLY